ncbi:MAG: 30S ribosomal protein S6 [Deltaproteobacteria bacterium]|nr:30S ribosomal protein S6 [Deltaproteobacteria bacterium]
MHMTEYETTVVVRPDVGGDAIEATLDRVREAVRGRGGKLIAINHWGKKRLAYPIKKHARGVYVHAQYLGKADLVAEVERNLRISDTVLRFLTVKVAIDVDPNGREEQAYARPQYEVEEATAETHEPGLAGELHAAAEAGDEAVAGDSDEGADAAPPATEEEE